jgi:hypothetical protein
MRKSISAALVILSLGVSGCSTSGYTSQVRSTPYEIPKELTQSDFVSMTRTSMSIDPNGRCGGYADSLLIKYRVRNLDTRDILVLEGKIVVLNLLDQELKSMRVVYSKGIDAGKSATLGTTGSKCYSLNQFDSGDSQILASTSGDRLKVGLLITDINYTDGTQQSFSSSSFLYPLEFFETVTFG